MTVYDPTRYWDGDPNFYKGTVDYIQVGGGWELETEEIALYNAARGTAADAETGFRCAADVLR